MCRLLIRELGRDMNYIFLVSFEIFGFVGLFLQL
jgi:hypothetical protein